MGKLRLENGTVLEVGKKYFERLHASHIEEVIFLDEEGVLTKDNKGIKEYFTFDYLDNHCNWLPYEEEGSKWYEYLHLNYESEEESRYVLWYSDRPRLANVIPLREWNSKEDMIKDLKG